VIADLAAVLAYVEDEATRNRHAQAVRRPDMPQPDAFRAVGIVTHATTDPEVVVTEFRYENSVNGTTMVMPCIWVTRVRTGASSKLATATEIPTRAAAPARKRFSRRRRGAR
jgi:ketosteroid isomerase-like protein